jgi:hypothetical protein
MKQSRQVIFIKKKGVFSSQFGRVKGRALASAQFCWWPSCWQLHENGIRWQVTKSTSVGPLPPTKPLRFNQGDSTPMTLSKHNHFPKDTLWNTIDARSFHPLNIIKKWLWGHCWVRWGRGEEPCSTHSSCKSQYTEKCKQGRETTKGSRLGKEAHDHC